ncbi:MAG: hypothetical protein AAF772_11475 [Acidobacteriota bacterium]
MIDLPTLVPTDTFALAQGHDADASWSDDGMLGTFDPAASFGGSPPSSGAPVEGQAGLVDGGDVFVQAHENTLFHDTFGASLGAPGSLFDASDAPPSELPPLGFEGSESWNLDDPYAAFEPGAGGRFGLFQNIERASGHDDLLGQLGGPADRGAMTVADLMIDPFQPFQVALDDGGATAEPAPQLAAQDEVPDAVGMQRVVEVADRFAEQLQLAEDTLAAQRDALAPYQRLADDLENRQADLDQSAADLAVVLRQLDIDDDSASGIAAELRQQRQEAEIIDRALGVIETQLERLEQLENRVASGQTLLDRLDQEDIDLGSVDTLLVAAERLEERLLTPADAQFSADAVAASLARLQGAAA